MVMQLKVKADKGDLKMENFEVIEIHYQMMTHAQEMIDTDNLVVLCVSQEVCLVKIMYNVPYPVFATVTGVAEKNYD